MLKVAQERGGTGRNWLPICGLLLLSLLWAVGWVRADLQPGASARWSLTPMMNQAFLLGSLALAASAAALVRRAEWVAKDVAGRAALVGIGLFAIPAVLTSVAKGRMDDAARVALFALTPLFAVIFEPYFGMEAGETLEDRRGLLAAMSAIAGTFLLFPVELPHSYGPAFAMFGVVATAALIAAANCAAVRLARQSISNLTFTATASGFAALTLGILALAFRQPASSRVPFDAWAIPDWVALVLLFWLMRRMSAAQMTTRFLISPLVANVMSLVLLRPNVGIQSWVGLSLIAAGAGWLLFVPGSELISDINSQKSA
jgi:drug/metabolite transporter (DMT)-like permease